MNEADKRGYMKYAGLPVGLVSKLWLRRLARFLGSNLFDSNVNNGASEAAAAAVDHTLNSVPHAFSSSREQPPKNGIEEQE